MATQNILAVIFPLHLPFTSSSFIYSVDVLYLQLSDCSKLPTGQGELIPCLLENRQKVTNPKCKHMLTKMQVIIFSNYRLIKGFFDDCHEDVLKFKCGRLETEDDEEVQYEVSHFCELYFKCVTVDMNQVGWGGDGGVG